MVTGALGHLELAPSMYTISIYLAIYRSIYLCVCHSNHGRPSLRALLLPPWVSAVAKNQKNSTVRHYEVSLLPPWASEVAKNQKNSTVRHYRGFPPVSLVINCPQSPAQTYGTRRNGSQIVCHRFVRYV